MSQVKTLLNFNPTGVLIGDGTNPVTVGSLVQNEPDTALSNAGANTLTTAQIIGGNIRRTGGGAQTDTTPTAAQIVAAIPGCVVGSSFEMAIWNGSGGVNTLGLGTGVTAAATVTTTLTTANGNVHFFIFRVTNVGTPAVTIYSAGSSAS